MNLRTKYQLKWARIGPLLFLIYINDLSKVCTYTTPILFADDTNIFLNGLDIQQMQNTINKELLNISNWLKANKLSLNVKKTHYMIFTRKKHIDTDITLSIDGEPIYEVQKTKFLGVIIDKKTHMERAYCSYSTKNISGNWYYEIFRS